MTAAPAENTSTVEETTPGSEQATTTPVAAPAEPSAAEGVARADLKMVSGDKSLGTMTFQKKDKSIVIEGQFAGQKKGQYALYIHDKGDCSDKGRKVGGHLNPTKAKHGPPASAMRHAGDFGDVTFDKDGNATFAMTTDSVTLEPGGADSVLGRAVVLHARKDSKSGSAGSAIACGVVTMEGAPAETRSSYTAPEATPATAASK
jgi:Cu-Zn family superoxide dismutase